MKSLLSVGIDIGTSTTSMVVSRLAVQNTAACFSVPHIEITGKEVVYQSDIYLTPLESGSRINGDAVAEIIQKEYQRAGITPDMVETGAVIITGESSRKENAALVGERLSAFAGDFVVATAGPDLEAIIAAKGAGAWQYAKEHSCSVVNLDIGGGTTNIAAFCGNELAGKGALDIGGRLLRVDADRRLIYISERMGLVLEAAGVSLSVGGLAEESLIRRATDRMAELLGEALGFAPPTPLLQKIWIPTSSVFNPCKPDAVSFSGGVADYIYHPSAEWFRHGDIGPLLADSIRKSRFFQKARVIGAQETIRATVVGAGAYTTTVSGSTIFYSSEEVFPVKNLPALALDENTEHAALSGKYEGLLEQAKWFFLESGSENILFCFRHIKNPSYEELCSLADGIAAAALDLLAGKPLFVLTEHDFAKSLGQALNRRVKSARGVACIDGVHTEPGDYLDFGRPLFDGMAVPVIVKTLIYS